MYMYTAMISHFFFLTLNGCPSPENAWNPITLSSCNIVITQRHMPFTYVYHVGLTIGSSGSGLSVLALAKVIFPFL